MPLLLVGPLFAILAGIGQRWKGWRALLGVAIATSAILLAWGLTEHAKYPSDEAIQVPVLMALVPPTISAATIHYLGKAIAPLWAQWVLATLAWALGLLVTGLTALYLNWITI